MEPQAPHHCPSGTVCVEPSKAPGEGGGPQENAAVGDARLSRHGAPEDEAAQADADAAVWAAEPLAVEFIEDLGRLRRAAVHELIHEHVAVVGPALVAVVVMAPAVHGGVDPHRVEASAADEGEFLVHGEGIGAEAVEQHHGAARGAGRFGDQGGGRAEQGSSHGVPRMASAARVSSIGANKVPSGEYIDLIGQLTEALSGVAQRTIGRRKAPGFVHNLDVTPRQIELIGRILRERSAAEHWGIG
jgi:hypothetical protein